ncbi:type II secretion system protein GspJ [Geobacter pickeringii]|uniref:type II secretion system protein GspJ n=1 Tax=Geobacter pickeringii TaxID=345632 RepID=UPI0022A9203F|nr:type II secretion system protein GspJ [Geobacter pickeringii]
MSGISRSRTTAGRGHGGFTLLEMLVALLLLVIVAGALYSSYFSVVRARERTAEGTEERRALQGTLDRLHREIDAAFYQSGDKRSRFVVEDRDSYGKPASTLELVTVAPPAADERPASDLVAVKYTIKEKDGTLTLAREAADIYSSMKAIPYPQMESLQSFLVECDDGSQWVRSWDTALNPKLPKRVRITLAYRDGDKTVEFSLLARPRMR